jgi:NTP pyrophosphatase (non-canonical NTP hydrolase)
VSYSIFPDGPTGDAVESVYRERIRQEDLKSKGKFDHTCADSAMSHGECLLVLMEEVGEVSRAILDSQPLSELRDELIQVAAVATAWSERVARDLAVEAKKKRGAR